MSSIIRYINQDIDIAMALLSNFRQRKEDARLSVGWNQDMCTKLQ